MRIPKRFHIKDAHARRSLNAAFHARLAEIDRSPERWRPGAIDQEAAGRIAELRHQLSSHPCHRCPDREQHARFAEQALRLERDSAQLEARMRNRTNTIAVQFDRICQVLESLGYLGGEPVGVTADGRMLARIYNELDLVTAECLRRGVFDDLSAPQLAAVLSTLVYESRRSEFGAKPPRMPDHRCEQAMTQLRAIHREISLVERDFRLERGPEPDIGFARAAFAWASGRPLGEILTESGLTAGDFVRWVRQVLDFSDQIRQAAGPGELRTRCGEVRRGMLRGVVAFAADPDGG